MPSEGLLQTQPAQEPPKPLAPRALSRRQMAIAGGALLVALLLGFVIGRATSAKPSSPTAPISELGRLAVVSKPAEGNVMLDGRFVGVSPIDHLDVDPGMHTIVIDVFGYQPYAGTLAMEPQAKVKLSVLLAPIGATGTTTGTAEGGKATRVVVPPSALLPVNASTSPAAGAAPSEQKPPRRSSSPPPSRPRRDCSGEKSRCRDGCSRASTDCEFSCPGCSSCLTSVGWDECNRQCSTCKSSCSQSSKFCESNCDTQYGNCEASQ